MSDDSRDLTEVWYRSSAKNMVIFALIFLGEPFVILVFVKWAFHISAALYLLLVPYAAFGLVMVFRPNWILRVRRAMDDKFNRDLEKDSQWWDVF